MSDSFTCAISHRGPDDHAVVDCIIEIRPPFNTDAATAQIANTLKSYRVREVHGDDYGKQWVIDAFKRHGIAFKRLERNRSEIYLEALPLFSSGRAVLLDNDRMVNQFAALERRVMPGCHDKIDHPQRSGHHDDLSNVTAAALVLSVSRRTVQDDRAAERPDAGSSLS